MKKAIATIETDVGTMTIFYNGSGVPMTGENEIKMDEIDYSPKSLEDALNAVSQMYVDRTVWQTEFLDLED